MPQAPDVRPLAQAYEVSGSAPRFTQTMGVIPVNQAAISKRTVWIANQTSVAVTLHFTGAPVDVLGNRVIAGTFTPTGSYVGFYEFTMPASSAVFVTASGLIVITGGSPTNLSGTPAFLDDLLFFDILVDGVGPGSTGTLYIVTSWR